MNGNTVNKKLVELAGEEISISQFEEMLKSSRSNQKIRVQWTTQEGRRRDYWFYWDSGAYVGGSAGGSATKARNDMYNLQGDGFSGDWRTLWLDTVVKCRYRGQNYTIK
jgi:hypothetical protein